MTHRSIVVGDCCPVQFCPRSFAILMSRHRLTDGERSFLSIWLQY